MAKQELTDAIIAALIAKTKSKPSPDAAKKIVEEAVAWAEAIESARNADRKYQMFVVG
jgi:hypothetical protein